MAFHYFNMLLRRISRERVFYLIIITNLAIGYFAFIILSQFISGEISWDKSNANYDRIYRVQLFMDQKENFILHSSSITAALSRNELLNLPEIEKTALIHDVGDNNKNGVFLSVDKRNEFLIRYGYYADASVFDIFTFEFIEGDQHEALNQPYSIVLSKNVADKLFPDGNAVGKQVYGENKVIFTVTGVYKDLPERSTWRPVFLLPMSIFTPLTGWTDYATNYWAYSFFTYVLLKPNATAAPVDAKIHDALKDYRKEHYPYLRPLSALHINPYFEQGTNLSIIIISTISILILLLSSINFINLQTANAATRFREIGIKKTLGFNRRRLWAQLLSESISLSVFAALTGIIAAQAALPVLNHMIGANLLDDIFGNWKLITVIFIVTVAAGFLSGIHPALVIASHNPVEALKQRFVFDESNGISLKKILVTIQFSISVFMLIAAVIVYRQTEYMLTRDMGFDSEKLLFANITTNKTGSIQPLREKLLQHPEIVNACFSDYIPYILPGGDDLSWDESDPMKKVFVRFSNISYDFVPTFGMKMMKGRNFSKDYPADNYKCLINETAARIFGWKEGIAEKISVFGRDYEVIGIIKDYIVCSVSNPLEPHLYRLVQDSVLNNMVFTVQFTKGKEKEALKTVKEEFSQFFPQDAFEFRNIQDLIQNENSVIAWKSFRKICGFIAILTLFISSIGLFGLMLLFTRRKMKEVGLRKVFGFSSLSLYMTLSSGFMRLLLLSVVISWPAAFYFYTILPGENKYTLNIREFLLSTVIILCVALGTITYQIIKAVKVRPVEILKDE
jgi:putative ABC transport system permease protein